MIEQDELDKIMRRAAAERAQIELQGDRRATLVAWRATDMKVIMDGCWFRFKHDQFKRLIPTEGEQK